MQQIWKYELQVTDLQVVLMPAGAQILSVANQNGNVCLWAMVDPAHEREVRHIEIIGTGHPIQELTATSRAFIGTVVVNPFVWHVFERHRAEGTAA